MGRRKKGDNSERVDPRNRKTIMATIDLDTREGELIEGFYKDVKENGGGLVSWKQHVTNALSLYIELLDGKKVSLKQLFPELADSIALYRELAKGKVDRLQHLFPNIVSAVRLYVDIQEGKLNVIRELFPERYQVFKLELEADILEGINQDTQKDLLKELRHIKAELENLKASGVSTQAAPQGIGGIKQIGTLSVPDPSFDDDDDTDLFGVRKDENAAQRVANNFLASITQAQNVKADPSVQYGRKK